MEVQLILTNQNYTNVHHYKIIINKNYLLTSKDQIGRITSRATSCATFIFKPKARRTRELSAYGKVHSLQFAQKPPVCAQFWKGFWHE